MEHPHLWPAFGAIEKAYAHFFVKADGCVDPWVLSRGNNATVVRATNQSTPPNAGNVEVLSQTTLRLAFMYGRIQADKKLAVEFHRAARSIAVQFMFLPHEDDSRRKRFELEENIKASGALFCLIGYKEALNTQEVRDFLKKSNRPATSEAVAQWYSKVKFAESAPDRKKIEVHLKIAGRLNDAVVDVLGDLESRYGRKHPLGSVVNLDIVCQKTSCKNSPLQDKLFAARLV